MQKTHMHYLQECRHRKRGKSVQDITDWFFYCSVYTDAFPAVACDYINLGSYQYASPNWWESKLELKMFQKAFALIYPWNKQVSCNAEKEHLLENETNQKTTINRSIYFVFPGNTFPYFSWKILHVCLYHQKSNYNCIFWKHSYFNKHSSTWGAFKAWKGTQQ